MAAQPHVAILRWPDEAAVVAYLRAEGLPRLLLVEPDANAPTAIGWDEDWIRLPAREDDVRARAEALQARVASYPGRLSVAADRPSVAADRVSVTADGRIFCDGAWVALSPIEADMAALLVQVCGEVVSAEALAHCSIGKPLSPTAVRVHMTRVRKRILSIGLAVRTVRGRGYVLERLSPRAT